MALSEEQIARLFRRCERRRRAAQAVGWFERLSRRLWPGLGLGLLALTVLRLSQEPVGTALWAMAAWTAGTAFWVSWRGADLAIAQWVPVARLDRLGLARGALMQRFEKPGCLRPVPDAALRVPWPALAPWPTLGGWLLVATAFALAQWVPVPATTQTSTQHAVSARVVQSRKQIETLERSDPQAQAFVQSAKKTLRMLESRSKGLQAADFAALERMDGQAKRMLQARSRDLQQQRRALDELESLITSREAAAGHPGKARALAEQMGRTRDAMGRGGPSPAQLQELLKQARALAQEKKGPAGNRGKAGSFDPSAARALRAQMGELRRFNLEQAGEGQANGNPSGQPGQGPEGMAQLSLDHHTVEHGGTQFESRTFHTQAGGETVLLATASSKRGDAPVSDPQGTSARTFQGPSQTLLWSKQVPLRHRQVLKTYFGGDDSE